MKLIRLGSINNKGVLLQIMLDLRFSHGVSCGQQGECAASLLWQNVFPSRSEGTLLFFFSHEFHITADGQAGCCC